MKEMRFQDLTDGQKKLVNAADEASRSSYSPYSRFRVGAALLTDSGEIVTASNVENASYGLSLCAETAVVGCANARGLRRYQSLAVIGGPEGGVSKDIISPCGRCRQVLMEMSQVSGRDFEIVLSDTGKTRAVVATVSELLPLCFGPSHLGHRG